MNNLETGLSTKTIALINGSGHGTWAWDKLDPFLREQGFEPLAVDLYPARIPNSTYKDYADAAAEQLWDKRISLLVAHSGGAHVVPGIIERLGTESIGGIVYIAGSLGHDNNAPIYSRDPQDQTTWARNSPRFQEAIDEHPDGMVSFKQSEIKGLFFQDCTDEDAQWAEQKMEKQCRPKDEPPLSAHSTDLPTWYILGREDQIRDRGSAAWAAGRIGMRIVEMDGGHSPAIARPRQLAAILSRLAIGSLPSVPRQNTPYELQSNRS